MNAVRSVMSVFLLIMLASAVLGWRWSTSLPSPKQEAARVVLSIIALSSVGGVALLWSAKPRKLS